VNQAASAVYQGFLPSGMPYEDTVTIGTFFTWKGYRAFSRTRMILGQEYGERCEALRLDRPCTVYDFAQLAHHLRVHLLERAPNRGAAGRGSRGSPVAGPWYLIRALGCRPKLRRGRLSNNPGNEVIRRREPYNFSGLKLLANGVKRWRLTWRSDPFLPFYLRHQSAVR
jgi:hypothetical protein